MAGIAQNKQKRLGNIKERWKKIEKYLQTIKVYIS